MKTTPNPESTPRGSGILLVVMLIVICSPGSVPQAWADPVLSVTDSLVVTDLELRGFVSLDDGIRICLVADPDTLVPGRDKVARLLWLTDSGDVTREHDVTGLMSRGLACDGKWLWGIGRDPELGGLALVQVEVDTLYIKGSYPLRGHNPRDLCWGQDHLWLVDRDSGKLEKIDPETGQVRQSYLAPGFSPCGVAHAESMIWITDFGSGRLYRMSKDGRRLRATVSSASYLHRGEDVMLVWDREVMWMIPPRAGLAYGVHIE